MRYCVFLLAYTHIYSFAAIGDGQLPANSALFMLVFAAVFAAITAFKTYASGKQLPYAKWIPSGIAFAIGFLNTPSFSLARLVGGVVEHVYHTRVSAAGGADIRVIVVASGFVLGEGVISVVSLILRTFGVGVISCIGCAPGLCGGCPA